MSMERESLPTWMYRSGPFGRIESHQFPHPDDIPEGAGWVDSPARVKSGNGKKKPKKKAK